MAFPLTSVDGDVKWNGTQVEHASGWSINPTVESKAYSSNKTGGKRNRRPGNIDATGSFTVYSTDGGVPMLPGQIAKLELFVDATKKWDVQNAIVTSTDPEVDVDNNELVGYTINWEFAGKDDGSGGSIVAPDGTELNQTSVGEVA